jgi:hypothetical protein
MQEGNTLANTVGAKCVEDMYRSGKNKINSGTAWSCAVWLPMSLLQPQLCAHSKTYLSVYLAMCNNYIHSLLISWAMSHIADQK